MEITPDIMRRSVRQQPFGTAEPFVTGDAGAVAAFYETVIEALLALPGVALEREIDHHGSGYASYIQLFLFPADGSSQTAFPEYIHTTGLLLYLSRLAPIAVYGASDTTRNRHSDGGSGGFIESSNVGLLPNADWTEFAEAVTACLAARGIELLPREPLLLPAPEDIIIPTVFDPPYFVFDTLFYWED